MVFKYCISSDFIVEDEPNRLQFAIVSIYKLKTVLETIPSARSPIVAIAVRSTRSYNIR